MIPFFTWCGRALGAEVWKGTLERLTTARNVTRPMRRRAGLEGILDCVFIERSEWIKAEGYVSRGAGGEEQIDASREVALWPRRRLLI